jgi:hypothetical protein
MELNQLPRRTGGAASLRFGETTRFIMKLRRDHRYPGSFKARNFASPLLGIFRNESALSLVEALAWPQRNLARTRCNRTSTLSS